MVPRAFVVADGVCIAIILSCSTRKDLLAGAGRKYVSSSTVAVVRNRASVRTGAVSTRVVGTVVDIRTVLTVTGEASRTTFAREALQRRRFVMTNHTCEAHLLCVAQAAICVGTHLARPRIAYSAGAAVRTGCLVIANGIAVAVVLVAKTRTNFLAGTSSKHVSGDTAARVRSHSSVSTVAEAPARRTSTVVDVCAVLAVTGEASWAVTTRTTIKRSRLVVTNNCREAR